MTQPSGPAPRRGGRGFVGRDRELAELVAGLEDALDGQGRLFLVAGEPGIGKTRLVEQLADQAAGRDAPVVWGRCWEGGGAPPFWPWAQIIRSVAEGADDRALAAWLGSGAGFVAQLAPDLAMRLGPAAVASAPSIESDAARFYLFDATAGFLRRAAVDQALVLILEDLHAADDPSLLLLRYLARDLRGARLLVVGTYRDVDVGRSRGMGDSLGELVREGQVIGLRGLAQGDVKDLIDDLFGTAPSEATVLAVQERTEGNPLFVREAVRLLASAGTLERPGRPDVPIPGSVRALIQQRLTPLSADAIQVLSAAAVIGRDFDLSLVAPACGLPTERVLGAVSEAAALGVVGEEAVAPGRYRFSHSLMREVVYEALPIPVRDALHRAVGEAIERLYAADLDGHVAELARHFSEVTGAAESARALTYARRAGDRAMHAYAYEEAAAQYRRALRALEVGGADVAGDPDAALEARCEFLLSLGAAQVRAGRYSEAKEIHLQAAEVARRLGSADRLARAALGFGEPQVEGGQVNRQLVDLLREALDALSPDDSPLRARLLARLSSELTFSDELHLIDSLSRQAVEMARRLGDVRALGAALGARWMAIWGPDGLEERADLAREILKLAQQTGDRDLELLGRAQRAATSLEAGDALAADADIAAHARLAAELRMPIHRWMAGTMRAMRALLHGSFAEAEALAEEACALQPERPNAQWSRLLEIALVRWEQGRLAELRDVWQSQVERFPRLGIARAWLALADLERGDRDAARRGLVLLAEQLPTRPRSGLWLPGVVLAAQVAGELEDAEAARALHPLLLPYADHVVTMNMEQPVACFGALAHYLGVLAALLSSWDEAAGHFEAAIRLHERLGAAPLLARTRSAYDRMLQRRGQPAERAPMTHQPPEPSPAPARPGGDRFQREGEYWTVAYDGEVVRLKDSKGLRQIALLLAQPGRDVLVTDLEAMVGGPAEASSGSRVDRGEVEARPDLGDAGELLDAEARAAYKARLDELQEEIDEADEFNDPVRAERARDEREFLVRELARAVGLGGRERKAASHAERARLNATRAIRSAMTILAREHPSLGQRLAATIRTGRYCSYTPDPRTPVDWAL